MNNTESLNAVVRQMADLGSNAQINERLEAHGVFTGIVRGYREEVRERFMRLHARREGLALFLEKNPHAPPTTHIALAELDTELESMCEDKAHVTATNLVVTVGRNYLLDNGLAGSAYTAAFFMGLVSSVSYSVIAAGDTQASHAGWLEAGGANAPTYSGARKTAAWSAASAASKALSAALVFTFTGTGTVKGCFLTTGSVVDGTTGTLYSAGLFTGGDQPVVSTNTLSVSYTASV